MLLTLTNRRHIVDEKVTFVPMEMLRPRLPTPVGLARLSNCRYIWRAREQEDEGDGGSQLVPSNNDVAMPDFRPECCGPVVRWRRGVATTKGKKGRVRKSDERKVQVGVEAELNTSVFPRCEPYEICDR